MPRKPEPESWIVPFRATIEGTTVVDAATADAAVAKVEAGDFNHFDPNAEMVDWEETGPAEPNE